jgi:hypothetical protein
LYYFLRARIFFAMRSWAFNAAFLSGFTAVYSLALMAVISAESFLANLPSTLLVTVLTAALAAFNSTLALESLALIAYF